MSAVSARHTSAYRSQLLTAVYTVYNSNIELLSLTSCDSCVLLQVSMSGSSLMATGCLLPVSRDLKIQNVLLSSQNHVRLIDFGLSKLGIYSGDVTGSGCGTPFYMAPEVTAAASSH